MSLARAIIWPGSFNDTSLPKVELGYAAPLPGSIYSWAADHLPIGDLAAWRSGVDGAEIRTDAGMPTVLDDGSRRIVRFDGTDDRMRIAFAKSGAHVIVAVFRFASFKDGDAVAFDYSGSGAGSITVAGAAGTLRGHTSSSFIVPDPVIAPDTSWHVAVLAIDGANSAFRVDDREAVGTLADVTRQGLTLGFSSTGSGRAAIDYARVEVIDGATSAIDRAAMVSTLRARYNI